MLMPPRYVYWTILAGGLPTAFRAAEREELLPTFQRLRERHPDAELKYFAQGQLWASPDEARAARESDTRPREARGRDWRPGGEHRDPRQKFKDEKTAKNQARRQERWDHKQQRDRPRSDWQDKALREKPHGDPLAREVRPSRPDRPPFKQDRAPFKQDRPPFKKSWTDRPAGAAQSRPESRGRAPFSKGPSGKAPISNRDSSRPPSGDTRPWQNRPPADRKRAWQDRPAAENKRPWENRPPRKEGSDWRERPPREKPHGDPLRRETKPAWRKPQDETTARKDWRKPQGETPPRKDWRKPQEEGFRGRDDRSRPLPSDSGSGQSRPTRQNDWRSRPPQRRDWVRNQETEEREPKREPGPNREPRRHDSREPGAPPRPSEPRVPAPGPPERGKGGARPFQGRNRRR